MGDENRKSKVQYTNLFLILFKKRKNCLAPNASHHQNAFFINLYNCLINYNSSSQNCKLFYI